jgi:STE24 endopeptidase
MVDSSVTLDPERQKQAKVYARIERRLSIVDMLFGAAYVLAWLVFGWAVGLRRILESWTTSPWILVPLFALFFGGIYFLIGLPLSYYSGFILPHRFGQSVETLRGWISDQLKSLLISLPIGFILLEIVYALLRAAPNTWWLWVAVILLAFQVLLANLAPVLIMPIFYKFIPLGEEHAGLAERLIRLAERAHTRVKGVYQFDMSRRTKSANAALTGLGNTRRIILGDTLLKEFSEDEIETVLAHELGHHVHHDIPVGIAVETVITLLGLFLASQVLSLGSGLAGLSGPADPASLPLMALAFGVYGLLTMPLTNAYLRYRERRADEYALEATANGPAFASALTRLANQNLAEADPERWVEVMFYSHPAMNKRIAMAQGAVRER